MAAWFDVSKQKRWNLVFLGPVNALRWCLSNSSNGQQLLECTFSIRECKIKKLSSWRKQRAADEGPITTNRLQGTVILKTMINLLFGLSSQTSEHQRWSLDEFLLALWRKPYRPILPHRFLLQESLVSNVYPLQLSLDHWPSNPLYPWKGLGAYWVLAWGKGALANVLTAPPTYTLRMRSLQLQLEDVIQSNPEGTPVVPGIALINKIGEQPLEYK